MCSGQWCDVRDLSAGKVSIYFRNRFWRIHMCHVFSYYRWQQHQNIYVVNEITCLFKRCQTLSINMFRPLPLWLWLVWLFWQIARLWVGVCARPACWQSILCWLDFAILIDFTTAIIYQICISRSVSVYLDFCIGSCTSAFLRRHYTIILASL